MVGCRTCAWRLVLIATACVLLSGCGAASPTNPGPVAVGYAGEWSGTTFQGRPISFTVSPEQQVTTISLGYQIDTCSGVDTFSDIKAVPFAASVPAFQFGAELPDKLVAVHFRHKNIGNDQVRLYLSDNFERFGGAGHLNEPVTSIGKHRDKNGAIIGPIVDNKDGFQLRVPGLMQHILLPNKLLKFA